jgi:hypothetical protein
MRKKYRRCGLIFWTGYKHTVEKPATTPGLPGPVQKPGEIQRQPPVQDAMNSLIVARANAVGERDRKKKVVWIRKQVLYGLSGGFQKLHKVFVLGNLHEFRRR